MATGAAPPVAQWLQRVKKPGIESEVLCDVAILFSNEQFEEFSFPVFEWIMNMSII